MSKIAFNFKSQRDKNVKLLSQGTDGSMNLRYESLITVGFKYKEIILFVFLDVNLWLKDDDY